MSTATIRRGASVNEVSAGGTVIDMSRLNSNERYQVRCALIEGLKRTGYFGKRTQRRAEFLARKKEGARA